MRRNWSKIRVNGIEVESPGAGAEKVQIVACGSTQRETSRESCMLAGPDLSFRIEADISHSTVRAGCIEVRTGDGARGNRTASRLNIRGGARRIGSQRYTFDGHDYRHIDPVAEANGGDADNLIQTEREICKGTGVSSA